MKFKIIGRNIDITDGLRSSVEKKLSKLDKYFNEDTNVQVALSVQKERQTVEVTIPVKGAIIRAEDSSDDMYSAIDIVADNIERQIRRHRKKLIDKKQRAESFSSLFAEENAEGYDDGEIVISRTKVIDLKPMDPIEACMQMDLLGHNFYMFSNSETDTTCLVYKKANGSYGLIQPEA